MDNILAKPLLPNEPRQLNWQLESELSRRFLIPVLPKLERFLLNLRAELDQELGKLMADRMDKPYPLGCCLEISLAFKTKLEQLSPDQLVGDAAIAYEGLRQFVGHGGTIRQIWGDLRGQYFQNAFLFGDLYVDVSNDTVVITKPKVEILPFSQANLSAINDFFHFDTLASRYWKVDIFPNHLFPEIAPYFPMIARFEDGSVQVLDSSRYMIALTTTDEFKPSELFLNRDPIVPNTFSDFQKIAQGTGLLLAQDPIQGRQLAIEYCEYYRNCKNYQSEEQIVFLLERVRQLNSYLATASRTILWSK